ncbi:Uncharacterised protein [Vibrio cholerae]|nr:Uncharacterised protein [Vibrio cholerae]
MFLESVDSMLEIWAITRAAFSIDRAYLELGEE